jgi:hypothetical protein
MATTQTHQKSFSTDPRPRPAVVEKTRKVVVGNVLGSRAVGNCLAGMANQPSLSHDQKKHHFEAAIAQGAADRSEQFGDSPYESALYGTVRHLIPFITSQTTLNRIREKTDFTSQDYALQHEMRAHARDFNDALRELICCASESDPARLNFPELVQVLSTTYFELTQQRAMVAEPDRHPAHAMIRYAAIGMRNEVAFEDMLHRTTLRWRRGEDINGADYWINGAKFDVKASEGTAKMGQAKAIAHGYNPLSIYDPRIKFEDFNNQLRLPIDIIQQLAHDREPELTLRAKAIRKK